MRAGGRGLFEALGAAAVVINIDGLYATLRDGRVDGHENPLAITEVNRLHEVTAIHAAARRHVARQRDYTVRLNQALEVDLAARGIQIEHIHPKAFRARLGSAFYARQRERCGTGAWKLLQDPVGRLD